MFKSGTQQCAGVLHSCAIDCSTGAHLCKNSAVVRQPHRLDVLALSPSIPHVPPPCTLTPCQESTHTQHLELHKVLEGIKKALVRAGLDAEQLTAFTSRQHDSWKTGLELLKKSPDEREKVENLANTVMPA